MINQYPPASSGGSSLPPATKLIKNNFSTSGYTAPAAVPSGGSLVRITNSTSATANALFPILTLSGGGYLDVLIAVITAAPLALRVVVTVDGTVAFDSTSASITSAYTGPVVVGMLAGSGSSIMAIPTPVRFNTSLTVQVASASGLNANQVAIDHLYRMD